MIKSRRRVECAKEREMKVVACGREPRQERVREGERQLISDKEWRGFKQEEASEK